MIEVRRGVLRSVEADTKPKWASIRRGSCLSQGVHGLSSCDFVCVFLTFVHLIFNPFKVCEDQYDYVCSTIFVPLLHIRSF